MGLESLQSVYIAAVTSTGQLRGRVSCVMRVSCVRVLSDGGGPVDSLRLIKLAPPPSLLLRLTPAASASLAAVQSARRPACPAQTPPRLARRTLGATPTPDIAVAAGNTRTSRSHTPYISTRLRSRKRNLQSTDCHRDDVRHRQLGLAGPGRLPGKTLLATTPG